MNHVNTLDDAALDCVSGGMDIITLTGNGPDTSLPGPTNLPGGSTCLDGPVKDQSRTPSKGPFSL